MWYSHHTTPRFTVVNKVLEFSMQVLLFAGSLRRDSLNKQFAHAAAETVKAAGHQAEYVDLKDYALPVYDGDIEAEQGIPAAAKELGNQIAAADALIIATPEYNGSIAAPLKNLLDWLSRDRPMSLANKPLLLLGASPGAIGAIRGLWHTRVPFEALGVHVFPAMMGLPGAAQAFDATGALKEEKTRDQLKKLVEDFLAFHA